MGPAVQNQPLTSAWWREGTSKSLDRSLLEPLFHVQRSAYHVSYRNLSIWRCQEYVWRCQELSWRNSLRQHRRDRTNIVVGFRGLSELKLRDPNRSPWLTLLDCGLRSLKLDGNKAGDQAITAILKGLVRHQPPLSHLGLADNRLTLKTMQVIKERRLFSVPENRRALLLYPHKCCKTHADALQLKMRQLQSQQSRILKQHSTTCRGC